MSIVTKTGDDGTTRLMFDSKASKQDARVDAYGAVDECSAALGVLRAGTATPLELSQRVLQIQKELIGLMGEVSTPAESISKYHKAGYARITPEMITSLETRITEMESMLAPFNDWCLPGGSAAGSQADWTRSVCRRAERDVCRLHAIEPLQNKDILIYLNRLSDWLWLEARLLDQSENDKQ
ncbi:MAG: cob(I)yrinic acid a,c-diamide adenosyltransferase [Verrucomicrobiota bacterium]|jgi:cob(I)alamin adenosyltransferase|nr:cob(I)yrinic acid a,c-diamide adenosyltransferase [Verrucomicrobiota bacterium]